MISTEALGATTSLLTCIENVGFTWRTPHYYSNPLHITCVVVAQTQAAVVCVTDTDGYLRPLLLLIIVIQSSREHSIPKSVLPWRPVARPWPGHFVWRWNPIVRILLDAIFDSFVEKDARHPQTVWILNECIRD